MDDEIERLTQRWIVAFCEIPIVIDAPLMKTVLEEVEARSKDMQDLKP